jgi:hypothetical protein
MALTKHERKSEDYGDREKVKFAIGLSLDGIVTRITDRKPSQFGGEVRYVEVDTTDGRKVSFGLSDFKLEIFEEADFREGEEFGVEVEPRQNKDGSKTYGYPVFAYNPADRAKRGESPTIAVSDLDIPF